MTRTHCGWLLALVATMLGAPARGQAPPALASGAHVRITAPTLGWDGKTGTLAEVRGDTLLVRRAGGLLGYILSPRPVPLSAVTTLEVSRNHFVHRLALDLGEVLGVVAGVEAGYALAGPCPPMLGLGWDDCGVKEMLLGATAGAALGWILAGALVPERWSTVMPDGAHFGLIMQPRGRVGVGVSLAF
jgi:hypothetical protein